MLFSAVLSVSSVNFLSYLPEKKSVNFLSLFFALFPLDMCTSCLPHAHNSKQVVPFCFLFFLVPLIFCLFEGGGWRPLGWGEEGEKGTSPLKPLRIVDFHSSPPPKHSSIFANIKIHSWPIIYFYHEQGVHFLRCQDMHCKW